MKRWVLDWCAGAEHFGMELLRIDYNRIGCDGNDTWKAGFIRYAGFGGLGAVEFHKDPNNPFREEERQRREDRISVLHGPALSPWARAHSPWIIYGFDNAFL
jgi:hypothetical protein